jgi:hypothetical protein
MKPIFTLVLLVITYTTFAGPNDGKLSITNLSNDRIIVEVDGKKYNNRVNNNENIVLISALSTGYHTLKVYTATRRGVSRNEMVKQTLIFQKSVNVKAKYHVDIVINRFGKVWLDELSMSDRKYEDSDGYSWYDRNHNDRDDDRYRDRDRDRNNDRDDRYNDDRYTIRAMNEQSFAALKETLTKERFDNSRLVIAKQVIDQNYFTTDQVKQLAQMYSFDNYKLDLVKYAYKNTVNKPDYFTLYEIFSFSSSKEDLANYIRQYK